MVLYFSAEIGNNSLVVEIIHNCFSQNSRFLPKNILLKIVFSFTARIKFKHKLISSYFKRNQIFILECILFKINNAKNRWGGRY